MKKKSVSVFDMDGTKSTRTFGAESPFGKGHFLSFCVSVVFFSLGITIQGRGFEAANSRWGERKGGEREREGGGGSERERGVREREGGKGGEEGGEGTRGRERGERDGG